jgi:serine phosphatase RsbU (regulator of sigma subunit)
MKNGYRHLKLRLLAIVCIILFFPAFSQTPKLDSLKKALEIQTTEDTIRANTLILLGRAYLTETNDIQKVHECAVRLLSLSGKLNYKKGFGYAYLNIGNYNARSGNYEQALYYYSKALNFLEAIDDKLGIGSCYQNMGYVKSALSDFPAAIQYGIKGTKITVEAGNKQASANGYTNIGVAYFQLGNYLEALTNFYKALYLREEINDKLGTASAFDNIGCVLYEQGKYKEALTYQYNALKIRKEKGDKSGIAFAYNSIANIYTKQKNYKEALTCLFQSIDIRNEIEDKEGIAISYTDIGNNYFEQHKINEALSFYLKGLHQSTEIGNKVIMVNTSNGIGSAYEVNGDFALANKYYESSLTLAIEIKYKQGVRDAYKNLTSINEKLQNYSKALIYSRLFNNLKDTLMSEGSVKQTAELNTRYETEKKEKEILLLTKDQLLKDKTLKEQRFVRIGLIIGLGLLLALSFLLFNRYRFKQKANLILEKQKEEIQQKNILITDSIDYAKTIQEAILPDNEKLSAFFPEYFILYRPKAIVSGDFYWIGKKGDKIICAVADCTGHGVPGAFMSLLGHNILENVIQRDTSISPGSILTALNEEILNRFSKGKERKTVKHGMDIAIISIDSAKQQVEYAGAENSLYHVRRSILTEIKADKQSTGIVSRNGDKVTYKNNALDLNTDDMLYLFTDGFADQKGGIDKRKFYYQPFKELLISIHTLPPEEQKNKLDEAITNWMQATEQIDDILVMGIRY